MDSWVTTLIKDIKVKVGFSGFDLTPRNSSQNVTPSSEIYCDYFPSGLSASEHRQLVQYILKTRQKNATHNLVNIFGKLIFTEDLASEITTSEPCLEMDMSKSGHACIAVPLKQTSWPPEEGYSFVCWFKYWNLKSQPTDVNLKLFSVSSLDEEDTYNEEIYLKEDGVLTLDINGTYSISSSSLELEEGEWYHLAIILGPRNALIAEHPSGIVYIYVDGKLRHTGEVRYPPLSAEKDLLISIGTPAVNPVVSDVKWALRSSYLFQEQLSPDCIRFMYIIGRGYRVLFQGGELGPEASSTTDEIAIPESDSEKIYLNLEILENLWLELCGKKLIFAFNATRIAALPSSHSLKLLNLADPVSFTSFPTGMPRSGHLCGDISVCKRCVTGNIIHQFTGMAVVLALVESAETRDMLYIALKLLASALYQNPHRAKQMEACQGYRLLSRFLHSHINLLDIQCLHIIFKISIHEDYSIHNASPSPKTASPLKLLDELYLAEYHESTDNSFANEVTSNSPSLSGALYDGDLVEHVLLDWTIWVISPVSMQLEILNFFETLVSVYKHKDHNLAILHERNTIQHLLTALHMDNIEMVVVEKCIVLLAAILQDKFLESEMNNVTMFILTTFVPPEVTKPLNVIRETKSKRVLLRNILLEALVDSQVTIESENLLEQWQSIMSSTLITYFLDEAIHPRTMGWIVTLLCLCITSSSTFAGKFHKSGGYQTLGRVLLKFNDSLDIYYTLFCVIFSKPIYPRIPEVGIPDFEALMVSNEDSNDLKFSNLLDSVVAMVNSTFDQLRLQPFPADHGVGDEFVEGNTDTIVEVTGEASLLSAHAASFRGLDSAANVTSILRFMANLAKMWPSFSSSCARVEFLESCLELYFSIVRTYLAMKATSEPNVAETVLESSFLASEGDDFWFTESGSQSSSDGNTHFQTSSRLLLEIDDAGNTGDSASAGATAVLDLVSEALSYSLIHQENPVQTIESILESVPLNYDSETVLTFKALCLNRIMNYLERRLVNNNQTDNLLLNMGSFCSILVDCVYIGVFPQPASVIRVLEFCLSVLHSGKKDGQIEGTSLPWRTTLLSLFKGSQPMDLILKSTNRMILYCFLPSFLASIGEEALIFSSGFPHERRKVVSSSFDICIVLELLHAHKEIVFHSGNLDVDVYCCLCIYLFSLFPDQREEAKNLAISVMKYMLTHCRAALEDILISKAIKGEHVDVLNGGFDKLLTENVLVFMEWFVTSENNINKVLQNFAVIRWSQYIEESTKFPVERLALLEDHRTLAMGKKVEDGTKLDFEFWDEYVARRSTLEAKRRGVCSVLEDARQKTREMGLHAEDVWRAYCQQLGHDHKLECLSTMAWEDYWPLC